MKVAILTMFSGLSSTYSLVGVVAEQLKMLLKHDISVKVLVSEYISEEEKEGIFLDKRIEWVKIKCSMNGKPIKLYDYTNPESKLHETFYDEVQIFASEFESALQDVSVCIMHDILYQGYHYVHNIAIREAQKQLPHVRFLSFTHSLPDKRPLHVSDEMYGRYTPMENTRFINPNQSGIMPLSLQYNVPEGYCHTVYNCAPVMNYLHESVQKLHEQTSLLNTEYMVVYPGRLSTGKKFDKVAALAGTIKRVSEKRMKVVFCDFNCDDTPADEYKSAIYLVGEFYGLEKEDIVFTSDYGFNDGFPREGVLDLFTLSNLFICPSLSENFSLTTLEAASRGNLLVLNECVPGLREAGEILGAYFMKWDARLYDSIQYQQYTPSERAYYERHSTEIIKKMREDKMCVAKTMIRNRFNSDWIWENQLKPLLEIDNRIVK